MDKNVQYSLKVSDAAKGKLMGKMVALISGGIDSPVASYLVGRLGVEIIPVYFDNQPFSDENAKKKALACCRQLRSLLNIEAVYVIPNGGNLKEFLQRCSKKLTCILCRRMMLRIAEKFAEEIDAPTLVTGESLGQVASQTLMNTYVENEAVRIPVLRPLYGFNKEDIVNIAKQIGTYEHSIVPANCCSANPKKPSTKAKLESVRDEERKLEIQKMVSKSLSTRKIFKCHRHRHYS